MIKKATPVTIKEIDNKKLIKNAMFLYFNLLSGNIKAIKYTFFANNMFGKSFIGSNEEKKLDDFLESLDILINKNLNPKKDNKKIQEVYDFWNKLSQSQYKNKK